MELLATPSRAQGCVSLAAQAPCHPPRARPAPLIGRFTWSPLEWRAAHARNRSWESSTTSLGPFGCLVGDVVCPVRRPLVQQPPRPAVKGRLDGRLHERVEQTAQHRTAPRGREQSAVAGGWRNAEGGPALARESGRRDGQRQTDHGQAPEPTRGRRAIGPRDRIWQSSAAHGAGRRFLTGKSVVVV